MTFPYSPQTWSDNNPAYPVSAARLTHLENAARDAYTQAHGWFDVRDVAYGAKGDGLADDTTAIGSAISACSAAGGGIVYLPEGTYLITGTLTLPAGVAIIGAGMLATVIKGNYGGVLVSIPEGSGYDLRDIGIDGNSIAGAIGLQMYGNGTTGQVSGLVARRVHIKNCPAAGINLAGYRHQFYDVNVEGCGVGVQTPVSTLLSIVIGQIDFYGCWLHDNTSKGLYLQSGSVITFHGGNIEHNGSANGYGTHINNDVLQMDVSFIGVNFEQNGDYTSGIGLYAQANLRGLAVISCKFESSAANSKQWKAFDLESGILNSTFLNVNMIGAATKSTIQSGANGGIITPGRIATSNDGWTIAATNWIDHLSDYSAANFIGTGLVAQNLKPTAALFESYDRRYGGTNSGTAALSAGRLSLYGIYLPKGGVISNITFYSGNTAANTPSHQWFALYDSTRNLIGTTADDTTTAWAANTAKTLALTSAYTVPSSGVYYVGIMVAGTAAPNLFEISMGGITTNIALPTMLSGHDATNTGLTTTATAPNPAAALTGDGLFPYFTLS